VDSHKDSKDDVVAEAAAVLDGDAEAAAAAVVDEAVQAVAADGHHVTEDERREGQEGDRCNEAVEAVDASKVENSW
jgi:hypothetical protein